MDVAKNKIRMVYYSGTGGTRIVAECMASQLQQRGFELKMQRLKVGEPEATGAYDLLVLLYPVYAFNAPEPVYDWIKKLPQQVGMPAVVISVSGGGEMSPNTACRGKAIKMLEKHGYEVNYENMLVMPSNIAFATKAPLDKMLLDVLPHKVEMIIDEATQEIHRRKKPKLIDRGLATMGVFEIMGAHSFGKRIRVSEACNSCGICSKNCPSGNITMTESRPRFAKKCYFCMNCLYCCPQKALKPGIGKFVMLKTGFDIDALVAAPAAEKLTDEQLKAIAPGFAWSGVRKYISGK